MAMRPQDRYKSTTAGAVSANRNYKDTVFRMLFSDKKNLLSLYNAVNSRDYTNPDDLEIVTLENAIYMGMKNDLAFIIDTNLYLYEHQSTYKGKLTIYVKRLNVFCFSICCCNRNSICNCTFFINIIISCC